MCVVVRVRVISVRVMRNMQSLKDLVISQFKWKIEKKSKLRLQKQLQQYGYILILGDIWIIHTYRNIFLFLYLLSSLFFSPLCAFHLSFVLNLSSLCLPHTSPQLSLQSQVQGGWLGHNLQLLVRHKHMIMMQQETRRSTQLHKPSFQY